MGEMVPNNEVRKEYSTREPDFYDKGCEYSESCLKCPLTYCKYDVPAATQVRYNRDLRIIDAFMSGTSAAEISIRLGIHERTVFLVLAGGDPIVKVMDAMERERNG